MWEHAATRANVATLRDARRRRSSSPAPARWPPSTSGAPAAWPSRRELLAAVEALAARAAPRPWDGLRVLVTAGGTREPIDACATSATARSGRMGFALADEAAALGRRRHRRRRQRRAAAQPARALRRRRRPPPSCSDAAEARVRRRRRAAHGRRRRRLPARRPPRREAQEGRARRLSLELERTADVLARLAARRRPGQTLVGFAAEHGAARWTYGARKLRAQGPRRGRGQRRLARRTSASTPPHNEVTIVTADGERPVPRADKAEVAARDPRRGRRSCARARRARHGRRWSTDRLDDASTVSADERDAAATLRAAHRRGGAPPRSRSATRCSTTSRRARRRGPRPDRGPARAWARRRSPARVARVARPRSSRACSARPTCCPPTSSAPTSSTSARTASSSGPGRSSPTSCSSTRSTARRPRRSRACSSACRSAASPSTSTTHELARPFLVLATQNPVEFEGTYPLPEAQVDRFMVPRVARLPVGRAARSTCSRAHEAGDRVEAIEPVADAAELLAAQDAALRVHASDALRAYVVALLQPHPRRTRASSSAPARAPGCMLLRAAKARALLEGRDHALPDDVQALAEVVLSHRHRARARGARRDRRGGRRRRAGGDAGAVAARRWPPRAPPAPPLLGAGCCCSPRRSSTPSRSTSPAPRFLLAGGRRVAWVPPGARGRARRRATVGARRACSRSSPCRSRRARPAPAAAARRACSDDPLLPAPAPLAAGRAAVARAHRRALRAPRAQACWRRRGSSSATRSGSWRASSRSRGAPDEVLVLPRIEPVRAARRAGDGDGAAAARRGRPPVAAEVDLDGLRPHREGTPASRIFWPALARGGELMERRLRAEGDTRPLVVLDPRAPGQRRGPRRRGARRGVAGRPPRARRRLRAAAARRPPPGRARPDARRLAARCTCAWPCSRPGAGPRSRGLAAAPRPGALRRRAPRRPRRRAALAARAGRAAAARRARRARRAARGVHGRRAARATTSASATSAARRRPGGRRRLPASAPAWTRRDAAPAGAPRPAAPPDAACACCVRLVAFVPLGALRRRPLGARSCTPPPPARAPGPVARGRRGRRSCCWRVAPRRAARRARRGRRGPRAGAVLVAALLTAGVPLRPSCGPRYWDELRRLEPGHRLDAARHACPTAASTRGSASRSWRAAPRWPGWPRCWPPGRATARPHGRPRGRRRRAQRPLRDARRREPARSSRSSAARSSACSSPALFLARAPAAPSTSAPPGVILALARPSWG